MVTYGFYNSLNHDRQYDAIQVSSIFDGIIHDGVYMSIGEKLMVTAGQDMTVIVGTGRAWFDHTWTLNDARLPLTIDQSEVILKRIDVIVLEVNADPAVRENAIKIIKGTPSSNPTRPTITNAGFLHQYPLASIAVNANATSIRQADITNYVGTSETPFVTGVVQSMNIDSLISQWKDQWRVFYEKQVSDVETWTAQHKEEWQQWFNDYSSNFETMVSKWYEEQSEDFLLWFRTLEDLLDENEEARLANEVIKLTTRLDDFMAIPRYTIEGTLGGSKWAGSGPWTQTIYNNIIGVDDQPIVQLMYDPPSETLKKQIMKQWGFVDLVETSNGSITFTCKFKKPTNDLPVIIKTGGGGSIEAVKMLEQIEALNTSINKFGNMLGTLETNINYVQDDSEKRNDDQDKRIDVIESDYLQIAEEEP